MIKGGLVSNLFGLAQKSPLPVWTYRLREKENAIKKHVRSLLNSACLRLLNEYRKPFFYDKETIISLVDIGNSFETDDYILEKQFFIPEYFLSSPEAWDTFINSFANLLMRYGKNAEKISEGIVRKYILGTEFINQSAYLKIDFEYMLFFPEDLDIQLEKGVDPEIGGKYYTPNGSTAILKNCIKVSKEEYKKLMEKMIPVASEKAKVEWNRGLEKVNKRGYGYVAEVVFNENDRKEYIYPANALVKVRYIEDLDEEELEHIKLTPDKRWELIRRFRDIVGSLLKKW
jgi:hypothetical protein